MAATEELERIEAATELEVSEGVIRVSSVVFIIEPEGGLTEKEKEDFKADSGEVRIAFLPHGTEVHPVAIERSQ